MTTEKTREYKNLAAAVSVYAQAASTVLAMLQAWDDANPTLDYGSMLDAFPHEKSMEEVVSDILAWRDALAVR